MIDIHHRPQTIYKIAEVLLTKWSLNWSFSFDFGGIYNAVVPHEQIAYTIADQQKLKIDFTPDTRE